MEVYVDMALTPDEERDFHLAVEYLRSHPVLSKMALIMAGWYAEELDEIRVAAGLPRKARVKTIRAICDYGKRVYNLERKTDTDRPGDAAEGERGPDFGHHAGAGLHRPDGGP